jgi:hypothetical protein
MKNRDIAQQRLKNQRLSTPDFKKPAEVVHWLGAVQAQDYYAAKWALGSRMLAAKDQEIEKAFAAGEILRTHVMRPTWHFVSPADIRWLLKLTAPRVNAVCKYHYRKLELDEAVFKRTNKVITKALLGGKQLTRESLRSAVQRAGVPVADLLRFTHILLRAELDGVICSGGRQGKQFTYALLEERVPHTKAPTREQALAELTRRYFTSHGPATLADFVWWSGLTVKDASCGLDLVQRHLLNELIDGKTYWHSAAVLPTKRVSQVAHLLPQFDEYLVSYKDRRAAFETNNNKVMPRANLILGPVIVIGGRVVGTWKRSLAGDSVRIALNYFAPLSRAESQLVTEAADRYGTFLGLTVALETTISPTSP